MSNISIKIIFFVIFCSLLGGFGQIFFKIASKKVTLNPLTWIMNPFFILGIVFYGISTIFFVWSLKYGDLSIIYPLFAIIYIWVFLLAYFFFGEKISLFKILGGLLIILGIGLIAR